MLGRRVLTASMAAAAVHPAVAWAQRVPAKYPDEHGQTVEAARREGRLVVYGTVSAANWKPFLELFAQRYPGISVETSDSNESWEKYYAESSTGTRTADLLIAAAPDRWLELVRRGQVAPYASPESGALPPWSMPAPGVYTASADPAIMTYNRRALQGLPIPQSLSDVAALVQQHPDLKGRVTVLDPEGNGLGGAIWMAWTRSRQNAWTLLDQIGPALRPERSAGPVREKIVSGEYAIAVFTSAAGLPQYLTPAAKRLTGWGYPSDGTPVASRNIAVTKAAASPNAARVFLDLLLSREGQIAFAKTGQSPYRADIGKSDVAYESMASITDAVGSGNVVLVVPDRSAPADDGSFAKRWRQALQR